MTDPLDDLERRVVRVRHRAEAIISETHAITTQLARIREVRAR